MNKHVWLSLVMTGMLLGIFAVNAPEAVSAYRTDSRATLVINAEPSFVYLRTQGFSISIGSPYDIVYYGNRYYLYHNDRWYRSSSYHGPWVVISRNGLPSRIRKHRLADIRRYRDIEYRKSDSRNNSYQRRDDNRRNVLEQKYKASDMRKVQQQPSMAPEMRKAQEQPNRASEMRKVPEPQDRAPEMRTGQEQPNRVPEDRKPQEQQKNGDNRGGNKDK